MEYYFLAGLVWSIYAYDIELRQYYFNGFEIPNTTFFVLVYITFFVIIGIAFWPYFLSLLIQEKWRNKNG